ncbi:LrgB family protein [Spongorhabdus nitratireducens]
MMANWYEALAQQTSSPLFFIFLTLAGYQLGLWVYGKSGRKTLFHPLIWATGLVAVALKSGPWSYEEFREGTAPLYMLLGPATVALAVPLERQFENIRQLAVPILVSLVIGGVAVAGMGVAIAAAAGGNLVTLLSTATKGVTTPVTLGIAEGIGSNIPLAVAMVVICGIYGGLAGPPMLRFLGITEPRATGFALGINSHAGGVARAFELDIRMGSFASLAMCLNAVFSSAVLPWIVTLILDK